MADQDRLSPVGVLRWIGQVCADDALSDACKLALVRLGLRASNRDGVIVGNWRHLCRVIGVGNGTMSAALRSGYVRSVDRAKLCLVRSPTGSAGALERGALRSRSGERFATSSNPYTDVTETRKLGAWRTGDTREDQRRIREVRRWIRDYGLDQTLGTMRRGAPLKWPWAELRATIQSLAYQRGRTNAANG